eukprot:TRINITY_DN184_c1_g1_i6.p3 TRINITY_DN184_c1_g1~~TRINITY_DN184_c1_g1_i6.p3  ORF type:complete len:228 (+),score=-8.42 TRINITY_DN184_c1_g1_i6:336-1019(+)
MNKRILLNLKRKVAIRILSALVFKSTPKNQSIYRYVLWGRLNGAILKNFDLTVVYQKRFKGFVFLDCVYKKRTRAKPSEAWLRLYKNLFEVSKNVKLFGAETNVALLLNIFWGDCYEQKCFIKSQYTGSLFVSWQQNKSTSPYPALCTQQVQQQLLGAFRRVSRYLQSFIINWPNSQPGHPCGQQSRYNKCPSSPPIKSQAINQLFKKTRVTAQQVTFSTNTSKSFE